ESVTPLVEPLSLDEAFLDVTASVALLGAPSEIARQLRARIARELHLPASAGIACTKFVAKIASDLAKPNGQREVREEETLTFLAPLPISRLWGVGPKSEKALNSLGLRTIGDLASRDASWIESHLGTAGQQLWQLSRGIDPRSVIADREAKSIGAEDTFEEDLEGQELLRPHIHSQALRVGRRLRKANLRARVIQLKLKYADFSVLTRQTTLERPTDDGQEIYRAGMRLLAGIERSGRVRLTGVSAHGLRDDDPQLALFQDAPARSQKLNAALDRIAQRFGAAAILTADLMTERELDDEIREGTGFSRLDQK
ncbi:MAG TPA: DNA polymerase IV, partial [Myxococcaceae bacterium]|nr:DNA polymerase IV [Myxococcaceae bacterium]